MFWGTGVTLVEVIFNLERGETARKKRVDLEGKRHPGIEGHRVCWVREQEEGESQIGLLAAGDQIVPATRQSSCGWALPLGMRCAALVPIVFPQV